MSKDFREFQRWFKHYQDKFGLNGWEVYFKSEPLEDRFAEIRTSIEGMTATAVLNCNLPDKDKPFKDVKRIAKHEALHLLCARLEIDGRHRYISDDEITEAAEELVIKLGHLID
jgi:hypothetical protein